MKLKNTAFAYNVTVQGSSNCDWGTDIGQGKKHTFTLEGFPDILNAMVYYKIEDVDQLKVKLGKGTREPKPFADYKDQLVLAACFKKIYVNGTYLEGQQFVMFILKDIAENTSKGEKNIHFGRCTLKFSNSLLYNDVPINQNCIDAISEALGVSNNGSWVVLEMLIENEDELHLYGFPIENNPKDYASVEERNTAFDDFWDKIDKDAIRHKSRNKYLSSLPLQQIFYGAPGTGKSHKVKDVTDSISQDFIFRTTFHPDSDYSTFVGAYKPTMEKQISKKYSYNQLVAILDEIKSQGITYPCHKFGAKYWESLRNLSEKSIKDLAIAVYGADTTMDQEIRKGMNVGEELLRNQKESKIVYTFVPQAFLKAYVAAWKNKETEQKVFLVIEEINRGNCAQIFGDIFQLLDRNDNGESEYPIKADQDIQDYLAKEFAGVEGLENNIQSGEELMLPANLHIWATMNTSDQSLFPIDSAFKRRWDWKYVPIQDGRKKWGIKVNGLEYDWWSFLEEINELIDTTTSSEDKKLGYYFCKPDEGDNITAERFVNKVIFYLWNDVFKDYDMSHKAFKDEDKRLAFGKFFNNDGSANEGVVDDFLTKLDVAEKSSNTEAQTGNGESTPELEEVYKEYWKRFEPYAKNKGYTFKAGAPYSHTYALDNVTYIVELPHGKGKNDRTKMLKLAVQMGPMEQGKLEDMNKSLPDGFMIDYNGYGSRLERRFDNVNQENLADSASEVIFESLIDELKKMIDIIKTNNPSSAQ